MEPGRPRSEEEKERDFITENKIFEIRPRSAKMDPGSKCSVTLVYKTTFTGTRVARIHRYWVARVHRYWGG